MKKIMRKGKIPHIKNKKLRIFRGCICIIVLLTFIIGVILGIIGGNNYDIFTMKLSIGLCIISRLCMGFLHILYFRTPKKWKKLFE